jgi:ABC-type multidrug transport system ATPase subunit
LLRDLAERGSTIVLSSHLLVDLERACTSLAVLEDGELLDSGPLHQVLDRKDRWIVEITGATDIAPDEERIRQALGADSSTEVKVRRPLRNLADLFRREDQGP